jgi:hypothetical protein
MRTDVKTVLVRRVVEARQRADEDASGTQQPYRTAALPPPNTNGGTPNTQNEKGDGKVKVSWWRRLKCW